MIRHWEITESFTFMKSCKMDHHSAQFNVWCYTATPQRPLHSLQISALCSILRFVRYVNICNTDSIQKTPIRTRHRLVDIIHVLRGHLSVLPELKPALNRTIHRFHPILQSAQEYLSIRTCASFDPYMCVYQSVHIHLWIRTYVSLNPYMCINQSVQVHLWICTSTSFNP